MSQPPRSLQPISCFSTESLVVNELRDWACDYTWEFARETFLRTSTKKHYYSFCSSSSTACPSHLCSLSPSPHHLSASHHAKKRTQTASLNLPTGRLSLGCVLLHVCWEGINQRRRENSDHHATCLAQGVDKGDILHTNAAPVCPSL